jgi:tetratricopeptide (TPR) repeat protein
MKICSVVLILLCFASCKNHKRDVRGSSVLSLKSDTLITENRLEEARRVIAESIELDSNNYAAYNNRAILNWKLKKSSGEVLADFRKALSIYPSFEPSLFSRTNYYFDNKDYESAIESADNYLERATGEDFKPDLVQYIFEQRGAAKYMLRRYKNAVRDFKLAIGLDSTRKRSHLILGNCYFYQDSINLAIKQFDIAIQLDSSYTNAYLARARSYESIKTDPQLNLAEEDYQRAFLLDSKIEDIYETNSPLFKRIKERFNNK